MSKEPIEHKHFKEARDQLRCALATYVPGGMIAICGMPGSGKTFVRNQVIREFLGAPESWGVGYIPATEVMTLLDTNAAFSSKAFAARSHRAALRPDIRALYREASQELSDSYLESLRSAEQAWIGSSPAQSTPEHAYWHSFAATVIDRKIKYVLIEHAAAIGRATKDEEPGNHLWNLMSLFDSIGCMGILNVIPEGHKLWVGRPEIAERLTRIFIQPYDILDGEQLTEFAHMVLRVSDRYEIESEDVIRSQINEIAIATATGVRPVEKLLERAFVLAKSRGDSRITAIDISSSFETAEHIASLWRQVSIMKAISVPAGKDELYAIHRRHLDMAS